MLLFMDVQLTFKAEMLAVEGLMPEGIIVSVTNPDLDEILQEIGKEKLLDFLRTLSVTDSIIHNS